MAFQVNKENYKLLSEVAEGMNPTELDEIIKKSVLGSQLNKDRGAYANFNEEYRLVAENTIVTYDNVAIAQNKLLDWFYKWFFNSFIEISLLTQINILKDVFDHKEIRLKVITKSMGRSSENEVAELRYSLSEDNQSNFEELYMMHTPFFSYTEKEMQHFDKLGVIIFMQKFIKKTKKLVR